MKFRSEFKLYLIYRASANIYYQFLLLPTVFTGILFKSFVFIRNHIDIPKCNKTNHWDRPEAHAMIKKHSEAKYFII